MGIKVSIAGPGCPRGLASAWSALSWLGVISIMLTMVFAVPANADNLAQMLYDVYDNNPDIRAEEAALDARKAATKKVRSEFLPRVEATGSHSLNRKHLKGGAVSRTRTSQYGLSASQRIFNGFQTRNNYIRSRYEERSGEYQVRNRERLILLEAVKAYMDVYAARRMINMRRKHLANLEKQRQATRVRIRAGDLTRTDLSKIEALLFRARASLEGAVADLGGAAGRYEALVGYKPGELIYPQMPVRYLPGSREEAERKAVQMHPDLRASRANIKARDYAVKAAKGAFLPTVDINGGITRNFASSQSKAEKTERNFSLRLSLPIFDGGSRLAEVEKAQAEKSRVKYLNHALAARIKADAGEKYLRNRAAQAALRQAGAEVKAARELLHGIRIEEKAGQRSFLDILDAEISLLDAQELEIYSQADSIIALYSFLASTGQLTVSGARKAYLQHENQAPDKVARIEQIDHTRHQKANRTKSGKPKDPWSGMR